MRGSGAFIAFVACGAAVLVGQGLMSWRANAGTAAPAVMPDLQGIDALKFKGHGDITLAVDSTPSLTIKSDDRDKIRVGREGATLVIDVPSGVDGDPQIVLRSPALRALMLSGSLDLTAEQLAGTAVQISMSGSTDATVEEVRSTSMRVDASGSTDLTIAKITADKLDIHGSGSSDVNIGGAVREQHGEFSGSTDYDAHGLASDVVDLRLSGSSEAKVHANKQLLLNASGPTEVEYSGSPVIQQHASGSFELTRVDG